MALEPHLQITPSFVFLKSLTSLPKLPFKMFPKNSAPLLMLVLIPQALSYTNVNDKTETYDQCYQCTTHRDALQSWHEGKGCVKAWFQIQLCRSFSRKELNFKVGITLKVPKRLTSHNPDQRERYSRGPRVRRPVRWGLESRRGALDQEISQGQDWERLIKN